ncbi:MAG TPA: hypothetical protein VIC61_07150 [Gammaproteobacteria bacterium]|jgi:hypothetical protein
MKIYSQDGSELLEVSELGIDGNQLVIKGRAFGSMPMSARLRPEEARKALALIDLRLFWFLLTLIFRR